MSTAKIYTYTIVRSSTKALQNKTPYCTSILELEDGTHISALLDGYVDGMQIEIGMEVKSIGTGPDQHYSLINSL